MGFVVLVSGEGPGRGCEASGELGRVLRLFVECMSGAGIRGEGF